MEIGIIGVGHIGKILARKFSANGHQVKVANSKNPETITDDILEYGAKAVTKLEAMQNIEVLILSVPLLAMSDLADELQKNLSINTIVIDTSNYYPLRDGKIEEIENGMTESNWVSKQIGRPVGKAWNAILADTLKTKALPSGSSNRIAIPVSADDEKTKSLVMNLVDESGFEPYFAGNLSDSWRQQPGQPAYCTALSIEVLKTAVREADKYRATFKRDKIIERISRLGWPLEEEVLINLGREIAKE